MRFCACICVCQPKWAVALHLRQPLSFGDPVVIAGHNTLLSQTDAAPAQAYLQAYLPYNLTLQLQLHASHVLPIMSAAAHPARHWIARAHHAGMVPLSPCALLVESGQRWFKVRSGQQAAMQLQWHRSANRACLKETHSVRTTRRSTHAPQRCRSAKPTMVQISFKQNKRTFQNKHLLVLRRSACLRVRVALAFPCLCNYTICLCN